MSVEQIAPAPVEARTVSVEIAGKILGISRDLAYRAVRTGEIPTIKIGHRLLVPIAALDRMLDEVAA